MFAQPFSYADAKHLENQYLHCYITASITDNCANGREQERKNFIIT